MMPQQPVLGGGGGGPGPAGGATQYPPVELRGNGRLEQAVLLLGHARDLLEEQRGRGATATGPQGGVALTMQTEIRLAPPTVSDTAPSTAPPTVSTTAPASIPSLAATHITASTSAPSRVHHPNHVPHPNSAQESVRGRLTSIAGELRDNRRQSGWKSRSRHMNRSKK